ncbi:MAG: YihY/virulence factor BrkB family protein [Clostridiales bacterium]|jgi:membrane protein|nr:YihY/virulence factor BrkB family protein [Clostridiales bacterium]
MKKLSRFLIELAKDIARDDIFSVAGELTYKLILAMFPFIIFVVSIIGFLDLNASYIMTEAKTALPGQVYEILLVFVREASAKKSPGLLSVSLLVSVLSASSGFNAIIRAINKSYGIRDSRPFLKKRLIGLLLTGVFVGVLLFFGAVQVFRDALARLVITFVSYEAAERIFGFTSYFVSLLVMLGAIIIIYRLSLASLTGADKTLRFCPGALFTVVVWTFLGKIFNLYIGNFTSYSKLYGGIGGVFALMLWLNLLSLSLLLGSEINSLLSRGG